MKQQVKVDYHNFFYPPGGILIWIIILVEWITFGAALIALAVSGNQSPEAFHASRLKLNPVYGTVNTLFLLTAGYFMALGVHKAKEGLWKAAAGAVRWAMLGGMLFVILKSVEYYEKIEHGLGMDYNKFFSFYWLLTGFHLVHVLVGLGILFFLYLGLRHKDKHPDILNLEAGAAFWHMVDLIWLMLFPMLYLVF